MNAREGESYLKLGADSRRWSVREDSARSAPGAGLARRAAQARKNELWPVTIPDVPARLGVSRGACSAGRSHDPVERGKTRSRSAVDFMISAV